MYVSASCVCLVRRGGQIPETKLDHCEPLCGCQESNVGPLKDKYPKTSPLQPLLFGRDKTRLRSWSTVA